MNYGKAVEEVLKWREDFEEKLKNILREKQVKQPINHVNDSVLNVVPSQREAHRCCDLESEYRSFLLHWICPTALHHCFYVTPKKHKHSAFTLSGVLW